mmetsp:Transcript_41056/g.72206  ORF Transcript_41056/g.72206 Transcript_41056/m.72206 type:complete len:164 (-) Transcript_41056:1607-2098(-)
MYEIKDCLNIYSQGMNGLPGVGPNWELFAYTNHQTDLGEFGNDEDAVYVLKNDEDISRRKCTTVLWDQNHLLDFSTLPTAQKLLGYSPRILVIGSGPGEPAATLASNFQDGDVISAHSTKKCVDWASSRFHKHGLSNVATRLVPSMENLDVFADGSFDLVASL